MDKKNILYCILAGLEKKKIPIISLSHRLETDEDPHDVEFRSL
jgi:hypothetical protein